MTGFAGSNLHRGPAHIVQAHHPLQITLVQQQCWLCACPVIPPVLPQTGKCHLTSPQLHWGGKMSPPSTPGPKVPIPPSKAPEQHAQPQTPRAELEFCYASKAQKVAPHTTSEAATATGQSTLRADPHTSGPPAAEEMLTFPTQGFKRFNSK